METNTCSCGCTEVHRVARRTLADGKAVILWSDGLVTFALGFRIRGIGTARESWAQEADLRAGWAFMGEAELFTTVEVPKVLKALRAAFRAPFHGRPGFRGGERAEHLRNCMLAAAA